MIGISRAVTPMLNTKGLAPCVMQSGARNLALKLKGIRDSSSPVAPRNDRLEEFFNKLLRGRGERNAEMEAFSPLGEEGGAQRRVRGHSSLY